MNPLNQLNSIIYSYQRPQFRGNVLSALSLVLAAEDRRKVEEPAQGFSAEKEKRGLVGVAGVEEDDLGPLVTVARDGKCFSDIQIYAAVVKCLAALSGKPTNVRILAGTVVESLVEIVKDCHKMRVDSATTSAAVQCIANCCGSAIPAKTENRLRCVDVTPALVAFLSSTNPSLQLVTILTLQILSTTSFGRELFLANCGPMKAVALLHSGNTSVLRRCVALLHALSADLDMCKAITSVGGVPMLTVLLNHDDSKVVVEVAGTLQNLAREKSSAPVMLECGVPEGAARLIVGQQTELQAAAIGMLLNLHSGDAASREQLKSVLAATIAVSVLDEDVHS